jgi:hypothetical protein
MPAHTQHAHTAPPSPQPVRLAFAICGTEFKDYRFAGQEWAEMKKEGVASGLYPYGVVPVLEVSAGAHNSPVSASCHGTHIYRYLYAIAASGYWPEYMFCVRFASAINECGVV